MRANLQEKIVLFRKDLEKYRKQVEEFRNYGEANELPKLLKKSHVLYSKFQLAAERIEQFNAEETAFGWMQTNYAEKDEVRMSLPSIHSITITPTASIRVLMCCRFGRQLVANLLPYKKLYDTCVNYKNKHRIWTEAKIGAYMPQHIENDVLTYHHYIVELCDEFKSIAAPFALTNSVSSHYRVSNIHRYQFNTLSRVIVDFDNYHYYRVLVLVLADQTTSRELPETYAHCDNVGESSSQAAALGENLRDRRISITRRRRFNVGQNTRFRFRRIRAEIRYDQRFGHQRERIGNENERNDGRMERYQVCNAALQVGEMCTHSHVYRMYEYVLVPTCRCFARS